VERSYTDQGVWTDVWDMINGDANLLISGMSFNMKFLEGGLFI
jgi:hypothetical protein